MRIQLAGVDVVLQLHAEEFLDEPAAQLRGLDGKDDLDAAEEVAGHPV